jgi:RNA polymerase sigma factor (sigma-70 family)
VTATPVATPLPDPVRGGEPVDLLVDHLFRRESGKMVAALTRVFGTRNLTLAEDVVQDTLLQALRQWPFAGIPANPAGWLYRVARNKALDVIRRDASFRRLAGGLAGSTDGQGQAPIDVEELVLDRELEDDLLRMMFTCCHPVLPLESQIALTLRILCGFSAAEIAHALLTSEATIQKRLYRAKQKIREAAVAFEVPSGVELSVRLRAVRSVLYLMFNEGYSASFAAHPVREDVCLEAMRLCLLLTRHPAGADPATFALMALMCFHAARLDGRVDGEGNLLLLREQDRSRWNRALIAEGLRYLSRSGRGDRLDETHLEAGIAALHCLAESFDRTDWDGIVALYDVLLELRPSPVVALNRAVAVAERDGPRAALRALEPVLDEPVLRYYHLLPATLGELYLRLGRLEDAAGHFRRALALTPSPTEKRFLERKLAACHGG